MKKCKQISLTLSLNFFNNSIHVQNKNNKANKYEASTDGSLWSVKNSKKSQMYDRKWDSREKAINTALFFFCCWYHPKQKETDTHIHTAECVSTPWHVNINAPGTKKPVWLTGAWRYHKPLFNVFFLLHQQWHSP